MKRTQTRPKGDKLNESDKAKLALEDKLESLQLSPPCDLDEYEAEIWTREIVPLIKLGLIKETDYSACVNYCELACIRASDLSSAKLNFLSRLRDQLGLTPAARLRVAPNIASKPKETLADVLKLHAV